MTLTWLIIAVIMLIGEFACPVFFMFWFAIGALAALVTSIFVSNITAQIIVFLVVSVLLTVFIKPLTNNLFKNKAKDELNINGLIGKNVKVIETINNQTGKGKVKVNGEVWTAINEVEDEIIEENKTIQVVKVDGVKLIVKKVD